MNIPLILADLFFMGSMLGWCIELFYRRFVSKANPDRKWINPGFCVGPWIPLYGCGLCILFSLTVLGDRFGFGETLLSNTLMFVGMALILTIIEYLAGLIGLKYMHIRLWDYRNEWGNIHGLVCVKFTVYWWALSALYYFVVHDRVLESLEWLAHNLAFSFFIGAFFGVFTIDAVYSSGMALKIRKFAKENDIIVIQERFKAQIKHKQEELGERAHFLLQYKTPYGLKQHLRDGFEQHVAQAAEHQGRPDITAVYKVKRDKK